MLDCVLAAAVFLRFAVEELVPVVEEEEEVVVVVVAGRGLRLVVPGMLEPAGFVGERSEALRPTMEDDWEARRRRSAAASISSLLGPAEEEEEEEEVMRRNGLRDRAPAPRAEAMLVGRGVALEEEEERSESR